MVVGLLLIGIGAGLGTSAFTLLSGMGLLAAFFAYVLGGMSGMILGLLFWLPFMRPGAGSGPSGPTPAPVTRRHAVA